MSADGSGEVAVQRTLDILVYLSRSATPVSAATIARDCAIPRSSVYRMLRVMLRMHIVVHLPDEHLWGVGIRAFEIGSGYLRNDALERPARPLLAGLTERTRMTSHLAVMHGSDVLYLLKQTTDEPARPFVTAIGVRLPAHLTAVGRAMLSDLSTAQVRAALSDQSVLVSRTGIGPRTLAELRPILREDRHRGYSIETGTTSEEVSCIAAAVHDHRGHPIAAVGVSHHDGLAPSRIQAVARAVTTTARELTRRVGGTSSEEVLDRAQ